MVTLALLFNSFDNAAGKCFSSPKVVEQKFAMIADGACAWFVAAWRAGWRDKSS